MNFFVVEYGSELEHSVPLRSAVFARGVDGSPWLWAFDVPIKSSVPGLYRILATGFEFDDFIVHVEGVEK